MVRYHFHSEWDAWAPIDRVREQLHNLLDYPQWWPQVLAVVPLDETSARVLCRSRLPYTLDLVLIASRREDHVLEVAIEGDLSGWARYTLRRDTATLTHVVYEQHVAAETTGLAAASILLRPVFRWNHRQMMNGCVRALQARLDTAAS